MPARQAVRNRPLPGSLPEAFPSSLLPKLRGEHGGGGWLQSGPCGLCPLRQQVEAPIADDVAEVAVGFGRKGGAAALAELGGHGTEVVSLGEAAAGEEGSHAVGGAVFVAGGRGRVAEGVGEDGALVGVPEFHEGLGGVAWIREPPGVGGPGGGDVGEPDGQEGIQGGVDDHAGVDSSLGAADGQEAASVGAGARVGRRRRELWARKPPPLACCRNAFPPPAGSACGC